VNISIALYYHIVMNLKLISTAIISTNPTRRCFNYFLDAVWISRKSRWFDDNCNSHDSHRTPIFLPREPSLPSSLSFFILPGQSSSSSTGNFTVYIEISRRWRNWMSPKVDDGAYSRVLLSFSPPVSPPSCSSSSPAQWVWTPFPVILYLPQRTKTGKVFPGSGIKRKCRDGFCFPTGIAPATGNPKLARDINPWLNAHAICCS